MKRIKPIEIVSIVLQALGTLLAFIGSVMMLCDKKYYTENYSYKSSGYYVATPESGFMPFFGFLLLFAALMLLIVGIRRNKRLLIGSIVMNYFTIVVIIDAMFARGGNSKVAANGYTLCLIAGAIMFITNIFLITMVPKVPKKIQNNNVYKPLSDESFYTLLKSIRELLDMGVLTQSEYNREKEKIMVLRNPTIVNNLGDKLQQLKEMHESGLLSDEDYNEKRKKLLGYVDVVNEK